MTATMKTLLDVRVKTYPDVRVAYMRFVGAYGDPGISRLWERFMAWVSRQPFGTVHTMYGVSHDLPEKTAPAQQRYDACIEVPASFVADGKVDVQVIPGGQYACTLFTGTPDRIHAAWMDFFASWLPGSGFQIDDRPRFERYEANFPNDPKTGAFTCELCIPIKPLEQA